MSGMFGIYNKGPRNLGDTLESLRKVVTYVKKYGGYKMYMKNETTISINRQKLTDAILALQPDQRALFLSKLDVDEPLTTTEAVALIKRIKPQLIKEKSNTLEVRLGKLVKDGTLIKNGRYFSKIGIISYINHGATPTKPVTWEYLLSK